MEQLQGFLASPNLPDIIGYIVLFLELIVIAFVKLFVKKDNVFTRLKFSAKEKELNNAINAMDEAKKEFENKTKDLDETNKRLLEEQKKQAKLISMIAGNNPELVKKGVAQKVSKELNVKEEEVIAESTIPEKTLEEEKNDR